MKIALVVLVAIALSSCSPEWVDCGGKDGRTRSSGPKSAEHIKDCPRP